VSDEPDTKQDEQSESGWQKKAWGRILVIEGQLMAKIVEKRREFVVDDDFSLEPGTLVGSVFHVVRDMTIIWQGVVVGEPQAGIYLCEIDNLEEGAKKIQRLFSLDTMMGLGDEGRRLLDGAYGDARAPVIDPYLEWRFYDNEDAATKAFSEWTAQRAAERDEKLPEGVPETEEHPAPKD
jgi:hypothetical protein